MRDGFKQAAPISCRFNNPISRKTRLSLTRVTFKPFGPLSLLANDKYFNFFPYENKGGGRRGCAPLGSATVRLDVATFWQRVQIFPVSTYGKVGLGLESHCLRLGIGVESTV